MAIYYISPYTTANGTGTWSSPYSFSSYTRAALVAGDEIRIIGKSLEQMLTTTYYTASNTSITSITITAGGGLGVDFVAGDLVYFPEYDSFARVTFVSGNQLSFGNGVKPVPTTSSSVEIQVRKVDAAQMPVSSDVNNLYLWNDGVSNVTISDCWISETERVTNGQAKSVIQTSLTTNTIHYFYLIGNFPSSAVQNVTINLQNTHILGGRHASAIVNFYNYYYNANININQILSNGATPSAANYLSVGSTGGVGNGGSFTIKHYNSTYTSFGSLYAINYNVTINNLYHYTLSNNSLFNTYFFSGTFTIGKMIVNGAGNILFQFSNNSHGGVTINFNDWMEFYQTIYIEAFCGIESGGQITSGGAYVVNFGPNFRLKHNRQLYSGQYNFYTLYGTPAYIPFPNPYVMPYVGSNQDPTGSFSNYYDFRTIALYNAAQSYNERTSRFLPHQLHFVFPSNSNLNRPNLPCKPVNVLLTFTNGDPPVEQLGINSYTGGGSSAVFTSRGATPYAVMDSATFNIAGPSLRIRLDSRQNNSWDISHNYKGYCLKSIKVPVIANKTYTITGFIKTDISTYVTGDCRVQLVNHTTELAFVDIDTAAINAWKPFTLTVNTTKAEELNLVLKMYFAQGNTSIWLSDLSITSN